MVKTGSSDSVRRTVLVDASVSKVWSILSKITDMWWAIGVKKVHYLAGPSSGVGSGRAISFENGALVKEIVTGWSPKKSLSYVATEGLPIGAYHATVSVTSEKNRTRIIWESVFADRDTDTVQNFKKDIAVFYSASLRELRNGL